MSFLTLNLSSIFPEKSFFMTTSQNKCSSSVCKIYLLRSQKLVENVDKSVYKSIFRQARVFCMWKTFLTSPHRPTVELHCFVHLSQSSLFLPNLFFRISLSGYRPTSSPVPRTQADRYIPPEFPSSASKERSTPPSVRHPPPPESSFHDKNG